MSRRGRKLDLSYFDLYADQSGRGSYHLASYNILAGLYDSDQEAWLFQSLIRGVHPEAIELAVLRILHDSNSYRDFSRGTTILRYLARLRQAGAFDDISSWAQLLDGGGRRERRTALIRERFGRRTMDDFIEEPFWSNARFAGAQQIPQSRMLLDRRHRELEGQQSQRIDAMERQLHSNNNVIENLTRQLASLKIRFESMEIRLNIESTQRPCQATSRRDHSPYQQYTVNIDSNIIRDNSREPRSPPDESPTGYSTSLVRIRTSPPSHSRPAVRKLPRDITGGRGLESRRDISSHSFRVGEYDYD